MSGKMLNKVMGIFGLEDEYEELEEDEMEVEEEKEEEIERYDIPNNKKQNKVVNIHTNASAKVVIVKPESFDEAAGICDDLKNRKIVVVNTSNLEGKIAQRLLDFIGGASYVLNGNLQEVERNVYILSPSNVAVSNELKNELSKGIFSFTK
ncbi:cell division protein SepF [Haloimpatiens lingqiaonensis]|uniref:cell division protein SepF n=1 Tax=Haloimpatiens lingqiaonensis TaxID=1380675 RepID=UPI0010FE0257|nr:cell division protein SepF [Haloimpatiens lingqiaonensis]